MAVNLTKPPRIREYTPVHLIDEEESIMRNSRGVPARSIEVSVVCTGTENLPAVAQKNELGACMDTLLEGIESADDGTQEKFIKFLKAAKKKKKTICKNKSVIVLETFFPAIFMEITAIGIILLGFFLPQIVEQVISRLPSTYADAVAPILESMTALRPVCYIGGSLGLFGFGISLVRSVFGRII